MSKGWVIGTREFGKVMVQEHRELAGRGPQLTSELNAAKEAAWDEALQLALKAAGRTMADVRRASKSEAWKLQLAAVLRRQTTATNRWLGIYLHLGARDEVSRNLSAWTRSQK